MAVTATDLIPGKPGEIEPTITSMTKMSKALEKTGEALKKIDTGGWRGPTREKFDECFEQEPPKWLRASDAFSDAAQALRRYQDALESAQREAEQVAADLNRADELTAQDPGGDALHAVGEVMTFGALQDRADPGAKLRAEAEQRAEALAEQVRSAAAAAASAMRDATGLAPEAPGPLSIMGGGLADAAASTASMWGDFATGAFDATLGLGQMANTLNPFSLHNMTHPGAFVQNVNGIAAGMVGAGKDWCKDPVGSTVNAVSAAWDGFRTDPAATLGSMIPDAVLGAATAGTGTAASAGMKIAREVADAGLDIGRKNLDNPSMPHPEPRTPPAPQQHIPQQQAYTPVDHSPPWTRGDDVMPPQAAEPPSAQSYSPAQQSFSGSFDNEPFGPGSHPVDVDDGQPFGPGSHPVDADTGPGSSARDTPQAEPRYAWEDEPDQFGQESYLVDSHGDRPDPHVDNACETPSDNGGGSDAHPGSEPSGRDDAEEPRREFDNENYEVNDTERDAFNEKYPRMPWDAEFLENVRSELPQYSHLHDEELLGINRWTHGENYQYYNEALRSGDPDMLAEHDPGIRNLVSGLNKLPPYEGGPVFRGLDIPPHDLDSFLKQVEPGRIFREPGFSATDTENPWGGNVELIIHSSKGKDISQLSESSYFHEVLFGPGTEFRCTARKLDEDENKWKIVMTDVE